MICVGPHNTYKFVWLKLAGGVPEMKYWKSLKLNHEQKLAARALSKKLSILRECVNREITLKQFFIEKSAKMAKAAEKKATNQSQSQEIIDGLEYYATLKEF